MQSITSTKDLKEAILQLEQKRSLQYQALKENIHHIYQSLKPINIIKSTLNEMTSTPGLAESILSSSIALTAGYFSKKLVIRKSKNIFRFLLGTLLQQAITNTIKKNSSGIMLVGQHIFQGILKKRVKTL